MDNIPQDTPQKQCAKCLQWFPATPEFFNKHSRSGLQPRCKACRKVDRKIYNDAHKEEIKQYAQEHKEEISTRQKTYRESHKEEISTQRKQHYEEHREERREQENARTRKRYAENREKERERSKRYGKTHRESDLARQRRYYAAHLVKERARGRMNAQKRRVRKQAIEGTLTIQQIETKLKAQKYACYYCQTRFKKSKTGTYLYDIEHTIPISRTEFSPRHDVNYVVLACRRCNGSKHDRLPHEWPQGGRLF